MSALGTMWRSIWRFHWLLAGILVLEYALTFAIVMVAAAVLVSRMRAINQSTGVDESGLYVLEGTGVGQALHRSEVFYAMQAFEGAAGQAQVAMANTVPFGGASRLQELVDTNGEDRQAAPLQVDAYEGGQQLLSVLGARLVRGRGFHADEIVRQYGVQARVVILSRTLAQRLFNGGNAVGRQVVVGGQAATVVGVVAPLAAPRYVGPQRTTYTLLLPRLPSTDSLVLIRYDGPVDRLQSVLTGLQQHDRGKVDWDLKPYRQVRARYFQADTLVVDAFAAVIAVVLVTAVCGILGLTSYWISRRRYQIAIRRALGASKRDIRRHFIAESGLLVAMGVGVGVVLGFLFAGLLGELHHGAGIMEWVLPAIVVPLLAVLVVQVSLRRWLRMEPVELIRTR